MKVIIEIPEKSVKLAASILLQACSNESEENTLNQAVENAKEAQTDLDLSEICEDESAILYLVLATNGINCHLQKMKEHEREETNRSSHR